MKIHQPLSSTPSDITPGFSTYTYAGTHGEHHCSEPDEWHLNDVKSPPNLTLIEGGKTDMGANQLHSDPGAIQPLEAAQ